MKRSEAIAPLSREHHLTLILVRLLKKNASEYAGLPKTAGDKIKYALQQYKDHIKDHFHKEEVILSKAKDCNPEISSLAAEIFEEHKQLDKLFKSLAAPSDEVVAMNDLAAALETHIRKEERVLFPLLEKHCSKELLHEFHLFLH